ncbi:MAG: thiamine-phosphate pyrophosphorylase [Verrucomicrobiales bacterium]|jgi:thiamine-phosphate pyrophosphorylase
MPHDLSQAKLYGILDLGYVSTEAAPHTALLLLKSGVDILQLRAKTSTPTEVETLARQVIPLAREAKVPFIINDFPEVAASTGADGVHVGQDDMQIADVRKIIGQNKIVGKSTHSLAQAIAAQAEGADYIGFGPLFATPTKPGRPAIGTEDIRAAHKAVTNIPIFCIGGVKKENVPELVEAGARRVVIVSGILQAEDPAEYTRDVKARLTIV